MKTIDNLTLKNCPELMTIICTIQAMESKIGYEQTKFKVLEKMTGKELWNRQETLIPEYNKTIK